MLLDDDDVEFPPRKIRFFFFFSLLCFLDDWFLVLVVVGETAVFLEVGAVKGVFKGVRGVIFICEGDRLLLKVLVDVRGVSSCLCDCWV